MPSYSFSDDARSALAQARREAAGFGHDQVGTEHVLLGIASNPTSIAGAILAKRGIEERAIRTRIEGLVTRLNQRAPDDAPFTRRAKRILEHAIAEARELSHDSIHTGHFLLGVLREGEGTAAGVLSGLGLTADDVHNLIIELTTAGRAEPIRQQQRMRAMTGAEAATMVRAMSHAPRIADVLARHGIDSSALIADLLALDRLTS